MSYIGNIPADKYQTLEKQSFTTSATTSYTLSYSVSSPQDISLYINNVRQNPNSSYTVSNTALTLSSATSSSDVMYAVFLGKSVGTVGVPVGGVGTSQIIDANITTAKIADSAVTSAKLASGLLPTNTPAFYATMSGNQNLSNNTATKLNFDTEVFDTDSKYDTSNFRFTPSTVGKYFVTFSMLLSSGASIGAVQVKLRKNGSDVLKTTQAHFYGNAQQSYMISGIINCASSSDYIEAFGEQDSGSTKPVIATVTSSFFQAYKLIGA